MIPELVGRYKRTPIVDGRISYIVAGVFVLLATILFVGFMLWIAGGRSNEPMSIYRAIFDRDVSGLGIGSPVRYLGVDVGEVTAIDLLTNGQTRVAVDMSVEADTPIHAGTYASLAYQGITGVAFINLGAEAGDFPALATTVGQPHPVIPTKNVGLAALFEQSGDITDNLNNLLVQARSMLREENQEALSRTLENIEGLTTSLANERQTLADLPARVTATLDEVQATVGQLRSLLTEAQPDLVAATGRLSEAADSLASLSKRFDVSLRRNETDVDAFLAGGLGQIPGLLADARRTLRELEKLASDLRDNPSQVIYKPQSSAVSVEQP